MIMNDFNMSDWETKDYILDVISGYKKMLEDPNQTEQMKKRVEKIIIKLQLELKKFENFEK